MSEQPKLVIYHNKKACEDAQQAFQKEFPIIASTELRSFISGYHAAEEVVQTQLYEHQIYINNLLFNQETNWLRKQVQSATKSYQEEILRYRIDLRFCGKNLIKSNDLLKEANRRKWYQFKEVK